jgi:hypothetical protein
MGKYLIFVSACLPGIPPAANDGTLATILIEYGK